MNDRYWTDDWDRLRAERVRIRERLAEARDGVHRSVRDPWGARSFVERHPYVVAGAGAAVAALLAKKFLGGRRRRSEPRAERGGSFLSSIFANLRNVAIDIATPLVTQFVRDKVESHFNGAAERRNASSGD